MVTFKRSRCLIGIAWLLALPASADAGVTCRIISIEIQNPTEKRIAPGQPILVALDVEAECEGIENKRDEKSLERYVGRALSEHVALDGTVYHNRLSEGMLNDIVAFDPKRTVVQTTQQSEVHASVRRTFAFVGNVFIVYDKKIRGFVFEMPGQHTIVFGKSDGTHAVLNVIVETPTPAEKRIIEKLHEDDLLITLATSDDCSAYSGSALAILRQLLEQARETRYEKLLAVAVGIGSMCELQKNHISEVEKILDRNPTAQVDRGSYEEGLLLLAKYFEQALPTEIISEFDIGALSHLAELELLRAKRASSLSEFEGHLAEFSRLSERVAMSPVASNRWSERLRGQRKQAEELKTAFQQP